MLKLYYGGKRLEEAEWWSPSEKNSLCSRKIMDLVAHLESELRDVMRSVVDEIQFVDTDGQYFPNRNKNYVLDVKDKGAFVIFRHAWDTNVFESPYNYTDLGYGITWHGQENIVNGVGDKLKEIFKKYEFDENYNPTTIEKSREKHRKK